MPLRHSGHTRASGTEPSCCLQRTAVTPRPASRVVRYGAAPMLASATRPSPANRSSCPQSRRGGSQTRPHKWPARRYPGVGLTGLRHTADSIPSSVERGAASHKHATPPDRKVPLAEGEGRILTALGGGGLKPSLRDRPAMGQNSSDRTPGVIQVACQHTPRRTVLDTVQSG